MTMHDWGHHFGKAAFIMGARRFGRHWHAGRGDWGQGWGTWPGAPRARRGDVKFAILEVLAERPRHGYDVIRALEERRAGYRPSPGSIYPTLQMLEDEGHVTSESVDGKRVYTLTASGHELLRQRPDEADEDEEHAAHGARHELREAAFRLGAAVWQVAREGDESATARVREILDRARREIYAILGDANR